MLHSTGPSSAMVLNTASFRWCRKKSNGCHSARHPNGFANEIASAPSPTHASRHPPPPPPPPRAPPHKPDPRPPPPPPPREQPPHPAPLPHRPDQRAEPPGPVHVRRAVGRPRPELRGRHPVELPDRLPHHQVLP